MERAGGHVLLGRVRDKRLTKAFRQERLLETSNNCGKSNGDQPTDRQTDTAGYRVACTWLKTN